MPRQVEKTTQLPYAVWLASTLALTCVVVIAITTTARSDSAGTTALLLQFTGAAFATAGYLWLGRHTHRQTAASTCQSSPATNRCHVDSLTGILNRDGIKHTLSQAIDDTRADPTTGLGLIVINVDRFKLVNDGISHTAGDDLLRKITARLQTTVDEQQTHDTAITQLGRCGGDEFALTVQGTVDHQTTETLSSQLHEALTRTYQIGEHSIHLSISIGVAIYDQSEASPDDLLRDADTAMYEAKRTGRGRTVWFDNAMHEALRDAVELENDLRGAIERNELFLAYQPIICLETASVTGFEALIRWRHPRRGLIRPDHFISIAEESLLIRPIGRWVIREALQQAKIWRQRFPELNNMLMNVNLSRVQFADHGLTRHIVDTLREFDLPHDALCLEITESTIMEDGQNAIDLLHQLRELGFKLAMDDFGTGYSSLSHLHEFPLDALKIDKSFIEHLGDNVDYAAVINAITTLAGNLGFTVVAEGLETPEQIAHLQALACHKGQGYFFHKPAEASVIEAYLSSREQQARDDARTA